MKLVMINDCAYVGETLIKYLPSTVEVVHLKRSREFWDKTLGITWKILKTTADVFHVHYLLQDCYLASKLGKKPLVGHAHGSDLRTTLKHSFWGRIVEYNLKNCSEVFVSTPDVLRQARVFREDAEYLPNPVDISLFRPKPLTAHPGRKRVLIASDSNWNVKGTDIAIRALSKIREDVDVNIIAYGADFNRTMALADSLGLQLNALPKVSHQRLNEYYWNADVVVDRFKLGSLGMVSLEAIACGRPVVTFVSSEYPEYKDFPLKDAQTEEEITNLIGDATVEQWQKEYAYLKQNHLPDDVGKRLSRIYETLK